MNNKMTHDEALIYSMLLVNPGQVYIPENSNIIYAAVNGGLLVIEPTKNLKDLTDSEINELIVEALT